MLTLAVVLVALPTLFAQLGDTTTNDERVVSYGAAILMLIVYAAYLVHTLRVPDANPKTGHARWSKRASLIVLAITAVATGVLSEVLVKATRHLSVVKVFDAAIADIEAILESL